MTKNSTVLLRRIFGVVLSLSILAAGICLIAACLSIYYSGDGYSPEAVRNAFASISVPVWICLILSVIGFVLELILPADSKKTKAVKNYSFILSRLISKKDMENCDGEILSGVRKERKLRGTLSAVQTVLLIVCFAVFLVYALNSDNFHRSEINDSMVRAMWVLIPCLALPFVFSVITAFAKEKSLKRETELLKQAPNSEGSEEAYSEKFKCNKKALTAVKIILTLLGAAVMIYGAIAGGTADVLTKAVNICTECIGLG